MDSGFLRLIYEEVWREDWWLPIGSSWAEVHKYTQLDYREYFPMCCAIAIGIYLVRTVFETCIARPLGRFLNVAHKAPVKPNPQLELIYKEKGQVITDSVIRMLADDTGLKCDEIKAWFKNRKLLNKKSQLEKFSEAAWRFTFYLLIWIYGVYVIHDKSWFWDTNHNWINYPRHALETDVYIYYTIEISFYMSLLVSQFFDVKRKDFWQMFLHHVVTLLLMIFSLTCNFQRVGSTILVLHDTADSVLELAKIGQYCKLKWLSDPMFVLFAIIWLVTRLILYPTKILYSTLFESTYHLDMFTSFNFFNGLLCTLQVMHVVWFYMIIRVALKAFSGKQLSDDRSVTDESSVSQKHEHKD